MLLAHHLLPAALPSPTPWLLSWQVHSAREPTAWLCNDAVLDVGWDKPCQVRESHLFSKDRQQCLGRYWSHACQRSGCWEVAKGKQGHAGWGPHVWGLLRAWAWYRWSREGLNPMSAKVDGVRPNLKARVALLPSAGFLMDRRDAAGPCGVCWLRKVSMCKSCARFLTSLCLALVATRQRSPRWPERTSCVLGYTVGIGLLSLTSWLLGHVDFLDYIRSMLSSGLPPLPWRLVVKFSEDPLEWHGWEISAFGDLWWKK